MQQHTSMLLARQQEKNYGQCGALFTGVAMVTEDDVISTSIDQTLVVWRLKLINDDVIEVLCASLSQACQLLQLLLLLTCRMHLVAITGQPGNGIIVCRV